MLDETFSEISEGSTRTFQWFKHFKYVKTFVENDVHSELPSSSMTWEAIVKYRRQTSDDIYNHIGLSLGTI